MDNRILVGIDIGTATIKALAGELDPDGDIIISGLATVETGGFEKGRICDTDALAASVKKAADILLSAVGWPDEPVFIGVGGLGIRSSAMLTTINNQTVAGQVNRPDIANLCRMACQQEIADEYRILQIIPLSYWVGEQRYDRLPPVVGTKDLRVEAQVIIAPADMAEQLISVMNSAGLKIAGIIANSVSCAEAVAGQAAGNSFLVLDMGAGITDLAAFSENKIIFSSSVDIGGDYITKDIMQGIGVTRVHAEKIKRCFGELKKDLLGKKVVLDCNDYGTIDKKVNYDFLYDIIESRVEEIVKLIHQYVVNSVPKSCLNEIMLTGGCSLLPSIGEGIEKIFGVKAQIVQPDRLPPKYAHPSNSAGYGILYAAAKRFPVEGIAEEKISSLGLFLRRLKGIFFAKHCGE